MTMKASFLPVDDATDGILESLDIDARFLDTTTNPIGTGISPSNQLVPASQQPSLRPDAALPGPSSNLRHVVSASNLQSTRPDVPWAPQALLPRSTTCAIHCSSSALVENLTHNASSSPAHSRLKNKRSAPNLAPTLSSEGEESTCLKSFPSLPGLHGLPGLPSSGLSGSMNSSSSLSHLRRPKFGSVRRLFDKVAT